MMYKKAILVISIVLVVFLAGCSMPDVQVNITSPIDIYSPAMSSVPGLPIVVEVKVRTDNPYEIAIEMKTDHGTLLEWGSDMKVMDMGKSVVYHDGTRYWSPFDGELGIAPGAEIDVKVTVTGTGFDSVTRMNVHIVRDDDGMFSLKIDK